MKIQYTFRRVEEGTFTIEVPDEKTGEQLLAIELACGTIPLTHATNSIIDIKVLEAKKRSV